MSVPQTPRYSVCIKGEQQWVEVLPTGDRVAALAHAATLDGAVVFDWATGEQVAS